MQNWWKTMQIIISEGMISHRRAKRSAKSYVKTSSFTNYQKGLWNAAHRSKNATWITRLSTRQKASTLATTQK